MPQPIAILDSVDTTTNGSTPPQEIDDEARVAAKYASMSLGDRAFAILSDLGMVDGTS